jgi:hypothetical protein
MNYLPTRKTLVIIAFLLVISLNFSRVVRAERSHDEDQFIASAILTAREGKLPYLDYPFFHTPNIIFVYAFIFKFTNFYLLAARIFTALCASAITLLLYWQIEKLNFSKTNPNSFVTSLAWVFLLIANPLFANTTSITWNHALSSLLCFAAIPSFINGFERANKQKLWMIVSGFLLGLSIGTRISYSTAIIAFGLAIHWHLVTRHNREALKTYFCFIFGTIIGLAPTIILFSAAPSQFIFGNFYYAQLNTAFRQQIIIEGPILLVDKVSFMFEHVVSQPGNLIVLICLVFLGYLPILTNWRTMKMGMEKQLLLVSIVPAIAIGSFLPSPSWYQYFFAPVPIAIWVSAVGFSLNSQSKSDIRLYSQQLLFTIALIANLYNWQDYSRIPFIRHIEAWRPLRVHNIGRLIQEKVDSGKVFTLAPLYPLEGGLDIFLPTVTAPFSWRVAPFLSDFHQRTYNLVGETNFTQYIQANPPDAIFLGVEPEFEGILIRYAQQNGYEPHTIKGSWILWIRKK